MRRAVLVLTVVLMAVPAWAEHPSEDGAPEGRFHLIHDMGEVLTFTWGGAQTAFALPTLTYLVPTAAVVGGSALAPSQASAHLKGTGRTCRLPRPVSASACLNM